MPTTYTKCDKSVNAIVQTLVGKYYSFLNEKPATTITTLFANAGEDKAGRPKPAIKRHGVACSAQVRATKLKERAAGRDDVEIIIDENVWDEMTEPRRVALIDHELYHLDRLVDKDDLGRPRFELKPHDFELWGFMEIIHRHKIAAVEARCGREFIDTYGQLLMFDESLPKDSIPIRGHQAAAASAMA